MYISIEKPARGIDCISLTVREETNEYDVFVNCENPTYSKSYEYKTKENALKGFTRLYEKYTNNKIIVKA